MRFPLLLAAPLLLCACADGPSAPAVGSTTDAPGSTGAPGGTSLASSESGSGGGSSSGSEASTSTADESLQPIALERDWVDALGGPWLGPVEGTPLGDLPQFYWAFEWTTQGTMRAEADNGMGFRFVFELTEHEDSWVLTETGTLPGGMTQSYDLHPVEREGDRVRFELLERPGFLQVDIEPSADAFAMEVRLRGEPHGTFALARPR